MLPAVLATPSCCQYISAWALLLHMRSCRSAATYTHILAPWNVRVRSRIYIGTCAPAAGAKFDEMLPWHLSLKTGGLPSEAFLSLLLSGRGVDRLGNGNGGGCGDNGGVSTGESTPGSGASASSRVAGRIASLQEKFAAAEQLLQGPLPQPVRTQVP